MVLTFLQQVREWCRGRNWLFRLPLVLLYLYLLIQYLRDPTYTGIIDGVNLGIHELGHIVFGFVGEFLGIAGGTILQILAPIYACFTFYRQQDFFAITFALAWLSTNLFHIATYMEDARSMILPLVSVGFGDPIHDWNYLLTRFNLLEFDTVLAFLVRISAFGWLVFAIISGVWLLWCMATTGIESQSQRSF